LWLAAFQLILLFVTMLSVWKRLQAESIEFNLYKAMNANDSGFALQKNKWMRELRRMESLSRFCYRFLVFTVIAFASVVIACAFWCVTRVTNV
jgi:hypothetical protein